MTLEEIEYLTSKINSEGFHYAFTTYSDFEEIEDNEFHKLRLEYIEAAKKLYKFIESKEKEFYEY